MDLLKAITLLRKAFPNLDGFPTVTFYDDESGNISYRKFVDHSLEYVISFENFDEFIRIIESKIVEELQ